MKKYTITCLMIISIIMTLSGCKDSPESSAESSVDVYISESETDYKTVASTVIVPEFSESTGETTTAAITVKESVSGNKTERIVTETSESSIEEYIIENEFPVISDSSGENHIENSESPVDAEEDISDDIIELPFVPVE